MSVHISKSKTNHPRLKEYTVHRQFVHWWGSCEHQKAVPLKVSCANLSNEGSSRSRSSVKHLRRQQVLFPLLWACSQENRHLTYSYFIKFHLSGRKHTHKNSLKASRTLFKRVTLREGDCVEFHHLPPGEDHGTSATKSELFLRKLRLPHQSGIDPVSIQS